MSFQSRRSEQCFHVKESGCRSIAGKKAQRSWNADAWRVAWGSEDVNNKPGHPTWSHNVLATQFPNSVCSILNAEWWLFCFVFALLWNSAQRLFFRRKEKKWSQLVMPRAYSWLFQRIIPGDAQEIICKAGDQTGVGHVQGIHHTHCILFLALGMHLALC